ncbi:MAG: AEC family transporter [Gammaproteobacteria bacterium]|nr:AEC family transporter [Gammaproteobacteria bacterium]
MNAFASALLPIMVLIFLGYGLKRARFLPEQSWTGIEKLTYYLLFPALLIRSLGRQTLAGAPWSEMLWVVVGVLLAAAALLLFAHRLHAFSDGPRFTSVFQGGIRFNTYIALAAAQGLYGAEGLALGSIAAGFMIVLINLLCVSVFMVWGKVQFKGVVPFVRKLLSNPLIIACCIGWSLSLSGIGVPGIATDILEIIGRAALPFGLLAVGAALQPQALRGHFPAIAISALVQFGVKPLFVWLLIIYFGLTGVAADVLIIAFMTPTAPSAYILARQLGGDTESMASIITFQTVLALLVMPLIAWLLLR